MQKRVKIFTAEQQFPCGPTASCCGPTGQSEQEIAALKAAVEGLGLEVEVFDIKKMKDPKENSQAVKLFSALGAQATPIITMGDEVVTMGQRDINEIITAINGKIK